MKTIPIYAGLALLSGTLACKPKATSSSVQSLDNFAAGQTVRINMCHGDPSKPVDPNLQNLRIAVNGVSVKSQASIKHDVGLALSAVPHDSLDAFMALSGKVVVTPDANKLCTLGGVSSAAFKNVQVTSCVLNAPVGTFPKDPSFDGMTLVLTPDQGVIASTAERAVGQMLVQYVAKKVKVKGIDGRALDPVAFTAMEAKVASLFLKDVAASKAFKLSSLARYLGPDADATVRKNLPLVDKGRYVDFLTAVVPKGAPIYQFADYVLVEAFDSYNCLSFDQSTAAFDPAVARQVAAGDLGKLPKLTNTRKIFDYFFPNTAAAYQQVDAYLASLSKTVAADDTILKAQGVPGLNGTRSATLKTSKGLGLAGNGGFWGGVGDFFSTGWEYTKAAGEGVAEGAQNIAVGTYNTVTGAGEGIGNFVGTTLYGNERGESGLGAATADVGRNIQTAFDARNQVYDQVGQNLANGNISYAQAASQVLATTSNGLPIVGNALNTANNAYQGITNQSNITGQTLTPEQQAQLSRDQGTTAGSAIVEAVAAKATGATGEAAGDQAVSGVRAAAQASEQGFGRAAANAGSAASQALPQTLSDASGVLANGLAEGSTGAKILSGTVNAAVDNGLNAATTTLPSLSTEGANARNGGEGGGGSSGGGSTAGASGGGSAGGATDDSAGGGGSGGDWGPTDDSAGGGGSGGDWGPTNDSAGGSTGGTTDDSAGGSSGGDW